MARTTLKIASSFLSTAVFFATFILAGDILVAAVAALFIVLAQLVIQRTTGKFSIATWGSFAIVLTLTSLSFAGNDTQSLLGQPLETTGSVTGCTCKPRQKAPGITAPLHQGSEAAKVLAPVLGPV